MLTELREAWLLQGRPGAGWVCPSPADPAWPLTTFRSTLDLACADSGVRHLHPHGLRHTAASRVSPLVSRSVMRETFGWTTDAMMRTYEHALDDARAALGATVPVLPGESEPESDPRNVPVEGGSP